MFEDLSTITLSGMELPIKCDFVVLEKIQSRYGSITEFENLIYRFVPELDKDGQPKRTEAGALLGSITTPPDLSALGSALVWMVREGIEIALDSGKLSNGEAERLKSLNADRIKRLVDIPPYELSDLVHDEFLRAFERKNSTTPQTLAGGTETTA